MCNLNFNQRINCGSAGSALAERLLLYVYGFILEQVSLVFLLHVYSDIIIRFPLLLNAVSEI